MRRRDERTGEVFSYVDLEARVRADHPLRVIREIANQALVLLQPALAALYAPGMGRPSIAPEKLLRAMVRSQRLHTFLKAPLTEEAEHLTHIWERRSNRWTATGLSMPGLSIICIVSLLMAGTVP